MSTSPPTWSQYQVRVGPVSAYTSFAAGCSGSLAASRLVPRDTPRVGATHRITLFDLPMNVALLGMGLQPSTGPVPLASLGMPGCHLQIHVDAATVLVGANQQAVFELAIPDATALVGVRFFHQALVLDGAAPNAFGAVMSDAAEGVVGHW